jgi:ATP-dependent DNA helicase RecG
MLDTPIEYLKGVGPQRAEILKKEMGVFTFLDLLLHYPFRYVDRSRIHTISEVDEEMPFAQLRGKIESLQLAGKGTGKRLVAAFRDGTGVIELVWFQGHQWMAEKLRTDTEYLVFGKPSGFGGRLNMAHPEIEPAATSTSAGSLQPVYSSTEKLKNKWLDSQGIRRLQQQLRLALKPEHISETLPQSVMQNFRLISRADALRQIHFPADNDQLQRAEFRLKFEELFIIQLRLLRLNKGRTSASNGFVFSKVGETFNTFYSSHLPYQLTGAQKRVLKEIRADMRSGHQMNRLLQGDVGSGKTLVALMAMLLAIDNGFQACLMAPTEILAQQHFATFAEFLKGMDLSTALLTGSTKTKQRNRILQEVADGTVSLLIGTHALIEESVNFSNLGLSVIDEQHRFGVAQRAKLASKNVNPPHVLLMTATPIPRTLAMTLYGDLDTSVIDELPPGRTPIKTKHFRESERLRVFGFMKEQIAKGRQVYVVYPLIKESEKMDFRNLQEGYDHIVQEFPAPQYQVSIVHGKLSNDQKEREMARFVKGETQVMVATTVIEVGVNVPNASLMVIESAERFGLSQLHQLRGRVGRGAAQSYCVLMTGDKLGADSRLRMKTMEQTNDGFEISEVDLKLRGPGDIEGTQQSGVTDLRIANLARDGQIVQLARTAASEVLDNDPTLVSPENAQLSRVLSAAVTTGIDWSKIG